MKPLAASTIQAVIAVAAILALALPATVNGQGRFDDYERTPLFEPPSGIGSYGPMGDRRRINEDGEWLLHQSIQVGVSVAAVWSNGQLRNPFGTAEYSHPVAINRWGTVVAKRFVGEGDDGIYYTLIGERSGQVTTVADRLPVTINDDEEVLLQRPLVRLDDIPNKAWIRYLNGTERELSELAQAYGRFFVTDMNDEGDVVGFVAVQQDVGGITYWFPGRDLFVLWHDAIEPSIIATLARGMGRFAWVNNARQIVAGDRTSIYNTNTGAYLWENGQLIELAPGSDSVTVGAFTDTGDVLLGASNGLPYPLHVYRNGQRDSLQPLVAPGGTTTFVDIQEDGTVYGYDTVCTAPRQCRSFFFRATPRNPPITDLFAFVSGRCLSLSWSLPLGATPVTGHVIEASKVPGGPAVARLDTGTATNFSTSAPADTYYVRVMTRRATGLAPPSNEVQVVIPQQPRQLPAPSNLAFTVDGDLVTLTWRAVVGATSYYLLAVANHTLYGYDIGPATSYQTFAPPGVYPVTIRARNACAESPGASIDVVVGCAPLVQPTLSHTVTGRSVVFSWNPAPPRNVTYTLEAADRPSGRPLASFPVLGTTWPTTNAPPGTYYVWIWAQNACGNRVRSNQREVIVP